MVGREVGQWTAVASGDGWGALDAGGQTGSDGGWSEGRWGGGRPWRLGVVGGLWTSEARRGPMGDGRKGGGAGDCFGGRLIGNVGGEMVTGWRRRGATLAHGSQPQATDGCGEGGRAGGIGSRVRHDACKTNERVVARATESAAPGVGLHFTQPGRGVRVPLDRQSRGALGGGHRLVQRSRACTRPLSATGHRQCPYRHRSAKPNRQRPRPDVRLPPTPEFPAASPPLVPPFRPSAHPTPSGLRPQKPPIRTTPPQHCSAVRPFRPSPSVPTHHSIAPQFALSAHPPIRPRLASDLKAPHPSQHATALLRSSPFPPIRPSAPVWPPTSKAPHPYHAATALLRSSSAVPPQSSAVPIPVLRFVPPQQRWAAGWRNLYSSSHGSPASGKSAPTALRSPRE